MTIFDTASLLLALSAIFGWINRRFLSLPNAIALVILGLVASLLLIAAQLSFPSVGLFDQLTYALRTIDFTQVVIDGMLAFLLFAGAMNVEIHALRERAWPVAYLALLGTAISTFIVGSLFWLTASAADIPLSYSWALVFGALISPTDPVAVLTMLKGVHLPERLKIETKGEALFNDGIGIVLFTLVVGLATGADQPTVLGVGGNLLEEAGGGLALGFCTGYVAYRLIQTIDDFPIEVLVTLALVTVTYSVAQRLGVSAPLSTVAAGLLVGNRGPKSAMSEQTQKYVFALWTLIDEVLNSVLFLLIGLEVLVLNPSPSSAILAASAVPATLIARWAAVSLPLALPWGRSLNARYVPFLTWAGVKGGISVALALSLPQSETKPLILSATYAVVLFTIIVQGLTLRPVVRWLGLGNAPSS